MGVKDSRAASRRRAGTARLLVCTAVVAATVTIFHPATPPVLAETGPTAFPFQDPDTIPTGTRYITYGTTVRDRSACGGVLDAGTNTRYVPFILHGNGEYIGLDDGCATGDAMNSGPGGWAAPQGNVFAPSVVYYGGRYIMYYTATKRNTTIKCIGMAESASATGPFSNQREVACDLDGGRHAYDPDAFVDGGRLYMTYRDDAMTTWPETGLAVVRMASNGLAEWGTYRQLLRSTDVSWDEVGTTSSDTRVVENPSMIKISNGRWYLFFSGNRYSSIRHATGVADCGTTPLPNFRCTVLGSTSRPYFGWVGEGDLNPLYGLPQNRTGPGGMSAFRTNGGGARVTWHFLPLFAPYRFALAGTLSYTNGVFAVA